MKKELIAISVRDLGVNAALVACGFEAADTYRDTNDRMYFIFHKTAVLEEAVNDYYTGTLQVRARMFVDSTKMLKARIYADR